MILGLFLLALWIAALSAVIYMGCRIAKAKRNDKKNQN